MKKFLSLSLCFCVALFFSIGTAGIPQGNWIKTDYIIENYGEDTTLELDVDKSLNFDKKNFFGRLVNHTGSCFIDFFMFSNPEVSGNTIKCKAYKYTDEGGEYWIDKIYDDCTITYDEKTSIVKISINDCCDYSFGPSDYCTQVISCTNNLNIRKTPVSGAKIGTMTTMQTLPLVSATHMKNGDVWYEVKLPDSSTGFVSGKYANPVSPSWLAIPAGFINPDIEYVNYDDDPNPKNATHTRLYFHRNGNQVLCNYFTGFVMGGRLPYMVDMIGHIEGNKIILDRKIDKDEMDADPSDLFDAGKVSELAKYAEKMDEEVIFYLDRNYCNGLIYDIYGAEYNPTTY